MCVLFQELFSQDPVRCSIKTSPIPCSEPFCKPCMVTWAHPCSPSPRRGCRGPSFWASGSWWPSSPSSCLGCWLLRAACSAGSRLGGRGAVLRPQCSQREPRGLTVSDHDPDTRRLCPAPRSRCSATPLNLVSWLTGQGQRLVLVLIRLKGSLRCGALTC